MNYLVVLLCAALVACSGKPGSHPGSHDAKLKPAGPQMSEIAKTLDKLEQEAKLYLSIAALPSYQEAKSALGGVVSGQALNELKPIHVFFAVQVRPELTKDVDTNVLTLGYVEAIKTLAITWWGAMPPNLDAPPSLQLLSSDIDQKLFATYINDATPLRGSESEDNTIARKLAWTAGDYIYAFLATKHQYAYDLYAEPALRQAAKQEFLKSLPR